MDLLQVLKKTNRVICFTIFIFSLQTNSATTNKPKPLGQLGQSTTSTRIYHKPNSKSKTLYNVKPYEYLIIKHSKEVKGYKGILLNNGTIGYIPNNHIAVLPYQVNQKQTSNSPSRQSSRNSLANYSLSYVGVPYKFGGECFQNGIDCSSFVQKLYGKIGINLPRTAAEQALVGEPINRLEHLKPGDRLYFWEKKRGIIGHTGMYLGNGYFVHSSLGKKGVSTDRIDDPKWRNLLVAARR